MHRTRSHAWLVFAPLHKPMGRHQRSVLVVFAHAVLLALAGGRKTQVRCAGQSPCVQGSVLFVCSVLAAACTEPAACTPVLDGTEDIREENEMSYRQRRHEQRQQEIRKEREKQRLERLETAERRWRERRMQAQGQDGE